jgi:hypothetical protein
LKKIVVLSLLILAIVFSCSLDEQDYMSNGAITGWDLRDCMCCGGYFIDIDKATYRFSDLPAGSSISLVNPTFPIYVKLDWAKIPNSCLGDEIKVLRIEKRL